MTFEHIQQSWKAQPIDQRLSAEAQLAEAKKRARRFHTTIMWRDVRELIASLFVAGVFAYTAQSQPPIAAAGSYFVAAIALGVGAFFVIDRWRQRQRETSNSTEPRAALARSLDAIDHQIWLLRNVAWWYIGPLALGVLVWAGAVAATMPLPAPAQLVFLGVVVLVEIAVSLIVYWLNQKAVDGVLRPQRDDFARLLEQWEEPAEAGE